MLSLATVTKLTNVAKRRRLRTACSHFYMESKKMELTESEGRMVLTGDYETIRLGVGEVNVDPMVQHFSGTVGSN